MTEEPRSDDRSQALALLSLHGLTPGTTELEALLAAYPVFRALAASSYTIPGIRYAEPVATFSSVGSDD